MKHFLWNCIPTLFWAQSLTTTWILYFVNKPDQKFLLFQNLIRLAHSYSSPHFIWTSSWLDWKVLFMILHTDNFWTQKLTTTWVFVFVNNPDQKLILFQFLLRSVNSYTIPFFNWTSSWLYWRTLFVLLHTDTFLSAKFENDMSEFFVDNTDNFFFFFRFYWEAYALIPALVSFEQNLD